MYDGVNLIPSEKKVTGAIKKRDINVIIEKRVMLSKESCIDTTSRSLYFHPQIRLSHSQGTYIFLDHDFFAKHVTGLVSQV